MFWTRAFGARPLYDKFLDRWHDKFSRRLRDTLFLTQALKRATADRTTVQCASFDKAFDLTTAVSPQAFPYTVMPVRISDDLAAMLQSHPMLPFQGAGGMTALTAQAFLDQGYDDYGKGSPRLRPKVPEKVNPRTKEQTTRKAGNPRWDISDLPPLTRIGPRTKGAGRTTEHPKRAHPKVAPRLSPKVPGKNATMTPERTGRKPTTIIMMIGVPVGRIGPLPDLRQPPSLVPLPLVSNSNPTLKANSPTLKAKVKLRFSQCSSVPRVRVHWVFVRIALTAKITPPRRALCGRIRSLGRPLYAFAPTTPNSSVVSP